MDPYRNACGIINGLCWLLNGALRGVIDSATGTTGGFGANPWLSKMLLGLNLIRNGFADPVIYGTPGPGDWEAWGTGVLSTVEGLVLYFVVQGLGPLAKLPLQVLGSLLTTINSVAAIAIFSINWASAATKNTAITRTKFAGQILSQVAGVPNPIKFSSDFTEGDSTIIVVVLDVSGGVGTAACIWAVTGENWDKYPGAGGGGAGVRAGKASAQQSAAPRAGRRRPGQAKLARRKPGAGSPEINQRNGRPATLPSP